MHHERHLDKQDASLGASEYFILCSTLFSRFFMVSKHAICTFSKVENSFPHATSIRLKTFNICPISVLVPFCFSSLQLSLVKYEFSSYDNYVIVLVA